MTNYWVLFNYDMVEAPGPADPSSSTPVTFLGVPWESSNPYTINWNASFHDQIIPSPYYAPPWGYHAIAYSFAEKGSWGPNGFTFSGIDYFNYTISIDNYYLAGSQPDPTVFTGPVLTATEHDDLSNYDVTVQWTDWAWALVSINAPAQLFTTSSDGVNFNALTFDQQTAIADGAETTNGLGGSDVVTLNAAHSTFQTGSLSGDTYRVSAGSGNYDITLGAGTDIVNISSNGSSTVTGGTGSAAITISGSGTNTINLGSGATNIRLTGDNNSIDFGAAGETANLYLLTGFQENINGFTSGDVLDIKGFGNLTLAAGIDTSGHASPGQVNLYSNSAFLGTLTFNSSVDYKLLKPVSDGAGGTKIVVDAAPGPQDPSGAGNKVIWSFVHGWESPGGITVLAPYISTGFSGLTMAQGVDVGDQGNKLFSSISGLFNDGASNPNLQFLDPFVGRDHSTALSVMLPAGKVGTVPNSSLSVSLTTTESNAITLATETAIYNQLSADYTAAAAGYGNGGWETLSANRQTAIFDLAYNIGLHRNPPTHYGIEDLSLWPLLAKQDWANASVRMEKTGGDTTRRVQDAIKLFDGTNFLVASVETPAVSDGNKTLYNFAVDQSMQYALDPSGPILSLLIDPGAPKIQSLELPAEDVADHYLVSYELGSTWSIPQVAHAGDVLTFQVGGVDGLKVTMLDVNGHLLQNSPDFTFFLTFASAGTFSGTVTSTSALAALPSTGDINGDGHSDIFWRNDSGALAVWTMGSPHGDQILTGNGIASSPDTSWHVEAKGDFNGDGNADVLWRNDNGSLAVWTMSGIAGDRIATGNQIGSVPDKSWHINGAGDFNGDGNSDILWRNDSGGLAVWAMSGSAGNTIQTGNQIASSPDSHWHIQGIGDFNGEGHSDILWRNDQSGALAVWTMGGADGTQITSGLQIGSVPDKSWHVAGANDFNGDGTSDILWRNDSGALTVWTMGGAGGNQILTGNMIASSPDKSWHVADTGDFNGDGTADILWRNDNGVLAVWTMGGTDGAHILSGDQIGSVPATSWHVQAHHFDIV
ncbi:FG-GAP-like repeat-containing protein [Bradyrhizobium sp. JR18.2]|uniref:FG-GAP-like repeat-containing protein n=1 Tax=Bradyrhizobium sp. JR18.2 TaxID=3156369 RepID=UPI003395F5A8